jgi:puromycin-sensitive aminopeptidase
VRGRDTKAAERCREIVVASLGGASDIDPELLAAATAVVAAIGNEQDYDSFVEQFRAADTPQEQLRFLYALADFDNEALIRRTVDFAFSDEVKTQNAPFLIGRAIANRVNGHVAWELLRQRWDEANTRFPGNTIVRMVDPVKLLDRAEHLASVQGFFAEHDIPQGAKTLAQILERQRVNVALRQRESERLSNSL